MPKMYRMA